MVLFRKWIILPNGEFIYKLSRSHKGNCLKLFNLRYETLYIRRKERYKFDSLKIAEGLVFDLYF